MKSHLFFTLISLFFLVNCSEDTLEPNGVDMDSNSDNPENPIENDNTTDDSSDNSTTPLTDDLRTFVFGHSLIVHAPPAIATPSNETTVPHWLAELAITANYDYAVSGQYGFLPQHANLPPIAQWGFERAEGAWDSDSQSFGDANFNSVLLTAGNFIQYQPATAPYEGENPDNYSPVSATLKIFDWVEQQEPQISFYIYENWPDMAPYLNDGVPATTMEFENYNAYTLGDFHDWWLSYHEVLSQERPLLNVKMIPVGPIISRLLVETNLSSIPFEDLYEDDAPHGRPTIYFLASLVTYMAMYGIEAPENFQVPDTVYSTVKNNYESTVDFIWNYLENFNDVNGNSLVF